MQPSQASSNFSAELSCGFSYDFSGRLKSYFPVETSYIGRKTVKKEINNIFGFSPKSLHGKSFGKTLVQFFLQCSIKLLRAAVALPRLRSRPPVDCLLRCAAHYRSFLMQKNYGRFLVQELWKFSRALLTIEDFS